MKKLINALAIIAAVFLLVNAIGMETMNIMQQICQIVYATAGVVIPYVFARLIGSFFEE